MLVFVSSTEYPILGDFLSTATSIAVESVDRAIVDVSKNCRTGHWGVVLGTEAMKMEMAMKGHAVTKL